MAFGASSVRKSAIGAQALVLLVLLLGREFGAVEAACDTNSIKVSLSACLSALNSDPDWNSQCCVGLRQIHDNMKPDDQCICGIMSDPQVVNVGLTKAKAASVISECVGADAVPACMTNEN